MQLFINNKQAVLMPDTSISIEIHNPIFDADTNGAFSYEFKIDAERNRHIIGNADLTDGESVYKALHLQPFRLVAEGLPLLSGVVRINKTVTIENGMIPISLASDNKEFNELIEDMNCQDVPIGEVLLGTAVKGIKVIGHVYGYEGPVDYNDAVWLEEYGTKEFDLDLPSKETLKPIANVSMPYSPSNPFCNMRRCWQQMQNTGTNENPSWNKTREYEVSEATEQGSAPSFYVLYWLSQLFKCLGDYGIPIIENQLEAIEDFKRLAFVNTNPCFEVSDTGAAEYLFANAHDTFRTQYDADYGPAPYDKPDPNFTKLVESFERQDGHSHYRNLEQDYAWFDVYYEQHRIATGETWGSSIDNIGIQVLRDYFKDFKIKTPFSYEFNPRNPAPGFKAMLNIYFKLTKGNAYATSKNFPDKDVKSTLQALQNAFGIRFLFDSGNQTVRIVLLRNIFRNTTVNELPGITHSVHKKEEHLKGIRITYGTSSDDIKEEAKAQGEKEKAQFYNGNDDSTFYNYHDFSDVSVQDYKDIVHQVSAYEKRCFYDPKTGNAYRVKVDSEATDDASAYPSLFEVAQCNPAEFGDCSDDDLTEEINIGFTPLFPNNVAKMNEEQQTVDGQPVYAQKFATFLDAEMHGEEEVTIKDNAFSLAHDYTFESDLIYGRFTLKVAYSFMSPHNFDRGSSEDAPIFKPTKGLVLGLMRGPGGDGGVSIIDQDYDGEGNDEWTITPGNYAFHADTMDDYGQPFDYNGDEEGVGPTGDNRFSLRLRAEKPNPAYDPSSASETVVLPDGTEVPNEPYLPIDAAAARRGLADKFYSEYAHIKLNGNTSVFNRTMELATLHNIDILQRQHIDDKVGFIKILRYEISEAGLSPVTIELLHL